MAANGGLHFVVRLLPSSGLDGAFRIHVLPESLDQAGLRVGDVCEITGEGEEVLGYGIAWRATDKMGNSPKVKPAKMTDALRNAFGIKEGSHVNLSKSEAEVLPAGKITLVDVTPADYLRDNAAAAQTDNWWWKCGNVLSECEAFASGMTFDVTARKGVKKRYFIEHVDGAAQTGTGHLFRCNDQTQVIFSDPNEAPVQPTTNGHTEDTFETDSQIGGLIEQLRALNSRLKRALNQTARTRGNKGILIHGYEGTGKSLILKQMEHAGFRKVIRLEKSMLVAGSVGKNQALIENAFNGARAAQPSLLIMDDLDRLAPSGDEQYSATVTAELDKTAGSNVLVVAACRTPNSINSRLLGRSRFSTLIELPIPDLQSRKDILNVLLKRQDLSTPLALRTHGFTGKDLAWLVDIAEDTAVERYDRQLEQWERLHLQNGSVRSLDGTSQSQATTQVEDTTNSHAETETIAPDLLMEDFDAALTKVRPTALREIFFETPSIKWSDIGGSRAIKKDFDEIIGWPLNHADIMEQYHHRPAKGVLLYGPPGCSKTLTAQAVATTYDLNFIAVKGAELVSMYVGESERAVREVFRKARAAAPCVIFFDEIDSIAGERDASGTKGLNVLTTLLNEMDGFESLKGVLVLAATNKPEILDPAIMRPGRFDAHLYLGPPNDAARKEIFDISMKGLPVEDDLDLGKLVSTTNGYTGAEIVQICHLATREAIRRKIDGALSGTVGLSDFEKALKTVKKSVTPAMIAEYKAFGEVCAA